MFFGSSLTSLRKDNAYWVPDKKKFKSPRDMLRLYAHTIQSENKEFRFDS